MHVDRARERGVGRATDEIRHGGRSQAGQESRSSGGVAGREGTGEGGVLDPEDVGVGEEAVAGRIEHPDRQESLGVAQRGAPLDEQLLALQVDATELVGVLTYGERGLSLADQPTGGEDDLSVGAVALEVDAGALADRDDPDFLAGDAAGGADQAEGGSAQEQRRRVTPLVLRDGGREVRGVETAGEGGVGDVIRIVKAEDGAGIKVHCVDLRAGVVRETTGAAGRETAEDVEGGSGEVARELEEILGAARLAVTEDCRLPGERLVAVKAEGADAVAQGETVIQLGDADLQGGRAGKRARRRDRKGRRIGTEEAVDVAGARAEGRRGVEGLGQRGHAPAAVAEERLVDRRREESVVHRQDQGAVGAGTKPVGRGSRVRSDLHGGDSGGQGAVELDRRTSGGEDVGRRVQADGRAAVDHDIPRAGVGRGGRDEGRAFVTDVVGAARTEENRAVGGDEAAVPGAIVGADGKIGGATLLKRIWPDDGAGQDEVVIRLHAAEVGQGGQAVEARDEGVVVVGEEALQAEGQRPEGKQLVRPATLAADGVQDRVATDGDDIVAQGHSLQVGGAVPVDADGERTAAQVDVGRGRQRRREAERPAPGLVAADDRQLPLVDVDRVEAIRAGGIPVVERQGSAADLDEGGAGPADDLAGIGPIRPLPTDGQRRAFHEERAAEIQHRALSERASEIAELLRKPVQLDRRTRLDDDRSADDGVLIPKDGEGVGDVEREHPFAHLHVALKRRDGGQGKRAGAELGEDVDESVAGVVAGVRERHAEGRDARRIDVEAKRIGAQMQRRAGGTREVGAGVEDHATHAQRPGRSRPHAQHLAAEVDALVRDEGVDRAITGEQGSHATGVVDLRGAGGQIEVAGRAIARRDDAAGRVAGEGGGGRSAGTLDHGPRPDDPIDQGGGGREDDLLRAGRTEVGVRAFEGEGRVGGAGQRTEGESAGLAAAVDGDDRGAGVDGEGAAADGGGRYAGEVAEPQRAIGDGEGGVRTERTAGRGGPSFERAGGDGHRPGEGIARGRREDHRARTDLGEAAGTGGRAGEGDVAAGLRRHVDPAGESQGPGEGLGAGVEAAERLGAAGGGVLERTTDRTDARGEDLGEDRATELDRRGAVAKGGVVPSHDISVTHRCAAGISVGAVEPEDGLLVLAEGESARDDAVDGEHAAAGTKVDGAAEDDVAELETIAVVTVEEEGAVSAAARRVGAGVADGERRQHDHAVLVADGLRSGDEDAVGIVVAARGRDSGIGQREG